MEEEGGIARTQRIFSITKLPCIIDICYFTFVQTHRMNTARMNPNVNYRFAMVMNIIGLSVVTCTILA